MVNTRSQTKMADNADLLALLAEMKKYMEKGQEEMKDRMEKGQEGMKEEMRKGQEEMKNQTQSHVETSQLVASLRGSAAEVLQGIPSDKLTDLMTIENALEARFGDSHLTQFYRTKLKTRRQKPGESLQVLAADVERLMILAYAECPQDV
ncbi:hypothetical protein AVEN_273502-1 [Araneus ventricosus]|uniref:Uncharacterized protein n=1 Tax=Araneus ventricosus TaxID=182803 RepID=A0A4Y2H609_ARAVE|nr:hypothetical protein AVEN_273502-1 [Araneus ventricosus]